MEGRGTVGQHAGAFGGQRVEGVGFGRGLALAGGQTPVETTEGDADGPGEQKAAGAAAADGGEVPEHGRPVGETLWPIHQI